MNEKSRIKMVKRRWVWGGSRTIVTATATFRFLSFVVYLRSLQRLLSNEWRSRNECQAELCWSVPVLFCVATRSLHEGQPSDNNPDVDVRE